MSPDPFHKIERDVIDKNFCPKTAASTTTTTTGTRVLEDDARTTQLPREDEEVAPPPPPPPHPVASMESPPRSPRHCRGHSTNSLLMMPSPSSATDSSAWSPTPQSPLSTCSHYSPGNNSLLLSAAVDDRSSPERFVDIDMDDDNHSNAVPPPRIPFAPKLESDDDRDSENDHGVNSQERQPQRHRDRAFAAAATRTRAAPNRGHLSEPKLSTTNPPSSATTTASSWMCIFDLDAVTNNACCGAAPLDETDHDSGQTTSTWQLPAFPTKVIEYFHPSNSWRGHLPLADDTEETSTRKKNAKRRLGRSRSPCTKHTPTSPPPPPHLSHKNSTRKGLSSLLDPHHHTRLFHAHATNDSIEAIAWDDAQAEVRRRPPAAHKSMSLAPNAAAALQQHIKDPSSSITRHKKSTSAGGLVAVDQEKVHVQTPGADRSALKDLPALRDAPPNKREELFVMKLQLCSVIFSFDDPTADKRGKDMKRQTLLELVDYVNTPAGQKIFTESVMGDLMAMVSANVCRALPPATDDFDPEEDEPVLEPAWPHLQVAYEFFLRFIVSSEVNAKAAKKYVDQKFCLQLVELFDSEDPRERDYLKTILHRIYGKFMSHRSFIRRAISNVFYRFVYETERHNGIGELLEILGSIINGFAIPLKKEHLQFLVRALIPLHKPKCVALYHQQLSYCIIQYVEKDADTATPILNGFFKCWPWSNSGKQVMFLNELEEILELLGADQLAQVSTMLFTNLARCLDSDHFQVVERALFLWNNEHLVNSGCLSRLNAHTVLPIIYGPLHKNSSGHWNATVEGLAQNVLKMYMEYDLALYDKCSAAYQRDEEEARKKLQALNEKWNIIEQLAVSKRPALVV